MALIFGDSGETAARTHALVIGIGGYRHLPGGTQEVPQVINHIGLLKQLTSPPRSAIEFAQFLLDSGTRWAPPLGWRAPLGSLELLVSPAPGDPDPIPRGWQNTPATIDNIRQAYDNWKERCNRHEDNIAVFYFCGHGVEKKVLFLLAEDFGFRANQPWEGAFDFSTTRIAFSGCRAKTQCFFIDACRRITPEMLEKDPVALPFETLDFRTSECENDLTILGAARNTSALGPRKKTSFFTQALIKALKGAVAKQGSTSNSWEVETGNVAMHIPDILGSIKESEGYKQRCTKVTTGNISLLRVPRPEVMVQLDCLPNQANSVVEIRIRGVDSATNVFAENHIGAPWPLEVKAGFYEASAHFTEGGFRNVDELYMFDRPINRKTFECSL